MLKRTYKVFLVVCLLSVAVSAQTVPQDKKAPAPAQAAEAPVVTIAPLPLLPGVLSQSLTMLEPATLAMLAPSALLQSAEAGPLMVEVGGGGYLGIYLEEVTSEKAKELGLGEERGAIVMKVVKDSPAEKAGLKENDVIVSFNNRRVDSVRELQRLMNDTPPQRTVSLEVIRGGSKHNLNATMGRRSGFLGSPLFSEEALKQQERARKQLEEQFKKRQYEFGNFSFVFPEMGFYSGGRLGVGVESLNDQLAEFFGAKEGGLLVTNVSKDTAADKAGLKAGDVIVSIDGEKVKTVSSLVAALNKKEEGQVSIQIIRDRKEKTVNATLEKRQFPRTRPAPPRPAVRVRQRAV
jgi:serine protease Do